MRLLDDLWVNQGYLSAQCRISDRMDGRKSKSVVLMGSISFEVEVYEEVY